MLSFADISSATAAVHAEVPKKVLCGLQTCHNVLNVERDLKNLFLDISTTSNDIQQRSRHVIPTITSSTGEMVGFLKAWEGLTNILVTMAKSARDVADLINGNALGGLESALEVLVEGKNTLLIPKGEKKGGNPRLLSQNAPMHGAAPPSPGRTTPPQNDRAVVQKLKDRLLLAEEEHRVGR